MNERELLDRAIDLLDACWAILGRTAYAEEVRQIINAHTALTAAEPQPAMGWRPIAEAPKTRSHLLLFGNGPAIRECSMVGYWREEGFDPASKGCWQLIGAGYNDTPLSPTHWMPLPPSPTDAGGEAK